MYNAQTPIDIHCSKLVDWLVQRRHCQKDWGQNLADVRRKIRAALKDMPEHEEIKELLVGSKLDYFKCKRIVEILKTTEASSKNIFGYYSSQRMKDWQSIISSYEKDYIYLADLATDLIRNTNYEIPSIRRLVGKLAREKEAAEKEKTNLLRKVQQFNSENQKLALSFGIKGIDVENELLEQSRSLYQVMEDIVIQIKSLKAALEHYRDFSRSTTKLDPSRFLTMIQYIIEKGNTTVYEFKYGEVPDDIIMERRVSSSVETSNQYEIDLDDEIDFGEDLHSSDSSSGFVHVSNSENLGNINTEDRFIKVEEADSKSVCHKNTKVAKGDEAKLVLEFRKTRNQLLNSLCELEAFYVQFSYDIEDKDGKSSSLSTDGRTQRCDSKEANQILITIRQITNIMNKDKNKILFQMNDSPLFLDSLKEKFVAKSKQATECQIKADLLSDKILNIESQMKDVEIHLKNGIATTKELQEKVESSIKELYNGRPINIMGCVG